MKVEYHDDRNIAYFNELRFIRDKKTGYYLSSKKINGKRTRLHIYVWSFFNGEIPKGYHIHHIDGDKSNNEISNLDIMSRHNHLSFHGEKYTKENYESVINNLNKKVIPKAKEWHKSEQGRKWHKEHYELMKSSLYKEKEFICENCGKKFIAIDNGINKFCSNACKTKARLKSGVDDEERGCEICGKTFITNKYRKKKTCSKECCVQLRKSTINRVHRQRRCLQHGSEMVS